MKMSCVEIEKVLTNSSISVGETADLLRDVEGLEECVEAGLRDSFRAGDWTRFYWYVLAVDFAQRDSYVPVLVEALDKAREEPYIHPAGVVAALSALASPDSVDALARAIAWRSERFANAAVAVEAMDALLHIVTPESRAVIASLVEDDRIEVRELAQDIVASPGEYW